MTDDRSKNAIAVFDKHAAHYQQKYMDTSLYHDTFDVFCGLIAKPNARILDVACGPGNVTQYLLSKRPDLNILGTDLAPNMLELAKASTPSASFRLLDGRDIRSLAETFDGIMCSFLFPYLSKEEAENFIADAAKLLNPGGVLYISTMEGDYKTSGIQTASTGDTVFVYNHEEAYLSDAVTSAGMTVHTVARKEYYIEYMSVTDLIIIAT